MSFTHLHRTLFQELTMEIKEVRVMTREQAVAELARIQDILPQIASALAEERKPVAQYAKTSYFKDVYGQSMGTVKNRKYGIMNQIKLGRYPKDAIMDRFIEKAV